MKYVYHVYSPMLEGFITMGLESREQAEIFCREYHDKFEAKQFRIVCMKEEIN